MTNHIQYRDLDGVLRLEPTATMRLRQQVEDNRVFHKGCVPAHVKASGLFKSEPCEKMHDEVAVTYYEYHINDNEVVREVFEHVSDKLRGAT